MAQKINSKQYSILLLLVIFISACRMGKEYQRPQLELPKSFTAASFADISSIADIEWKKFFTDTSLQSLIDRGITYNQDLLLAVRPGITGYWQVHGRQEVSYEERVQMDVEYIRNWSLALDLKLLCLTPARVIRGRGAY